MRNITTYFLQAILLFIFITSTMPVFSAGEPTSAGTGFVVNPDGYLLTCEHVVRNADKIKVTLGAKTWDAAVISVDKVHDLALIQIPAKGLTALPLSNSNAIEVGQEARAFGYPLTYLLGEDMKVTRGIVAGISIRDALKIIQIDTAVNAGNSGGPLVNEKGEVIGVVNAKLVGISVTNVGFAVPINYSKPLLQAEGIKFTEEGSKERIDGPALVKLVSPSVALITVWEKSSPDLTNPKSSSKYDKTPTILINQKDDAEMVLIPAGEFLMGSLNDDKLARNNEKPQHKVNLDAYYIYKTEVTVAQYSKFCKAMEREMPEEPSWKWINTNPIVNVSWGDANAYAKWAGVELPSEAEWEKAARGTGGRIYPWGNNWDINMLRCSKMTQGDANKTISVGVYSVGASPFGVMDMAGNVWEWCSDWYDENYYKNAVCNNPKGPEKGITKVLRGGGWSDFAAEKFRVTFRDNYLPIDTYYGTGFRCVFHTPTP